MEYKDNVILNLSMFIQNSRAWVLLGDSAILVNYALDNIRQHITSENKLSKVFVSTDNSGFDDVASDNAEITNGLAVCKLEDLIGKIDKPMSGRWWCSVNYDSLNKKERAFLFNYLKAPDKNVMLTVTVSDFRNIIDMRRSRVFSNNEYSHIINLQYPSHKYLTAIITSLFAEKNVKLSADQTNLFIMKLGSAYEELKDCVDQVAANLTAQLGANKGDVIKDLNGYEFNKAIKNIDHFDLDDLVRYMLSPFKSDKTLNGRRKIHKLLAQLLVNMPASEICKRLKSKVKTFMVYRTAINQGIIPIKVPYSISDVQSKLPDTPLYEKLKKASGFSFKRSAYISSLTSIADWFFIYTMLENIPYGSTEDRYMMTLLSVINRTAVSNDRLMNNIGIKNTLDEGLYILNGIYYSDGYKSHLFSLPDPSKTSINSDNLDDDISFDTTTDEFDDEFDDETALAVEEDDDLNENMDDVEESELYDLQELLSTYKQI